MRKSLDKNYIIINYIYMLKLLFFYLIYSFVLQNFNPGLWAMEQRQGMIFLYIFSLVFHAMTLFRYDFHGDRWDIDDDWFFKLFLF